MDLRQYYKDKKAVEEELAATAENGIVYVTSVFHREKNSTAGCTLSAAPSNAARVVTDGTHRKATPDEVKDFHLEQQSRLKRTTLAEQKKKQQYIVVVDQNQPSQAAFVQGLSAPEPKVDVKAPEGKDSTK